MNILVYGSKLAVDRMKPTLDNIVYFLTKRDLKYQEKVGHSRARSKLILYRTRV